MDAKPDSNLVWLTAVDFNKMSVFIWIGGIITAILLTGIGWGLYRLIHYPKVCLTRWAKVTESDIQRYSTACEKYFREELKLELDLCDLNRSMEVIIQNYNRAWSRDYEYFKAGVLQRDNKGKPVSFVPRDKALAKEYFPWFMVFPLGCYIGEMVRKKYHGQWVASECGLMLKLPIGSDSQDGITLNPVIKLIKINAGSADPLELLAYLTFLANLDSEVGKAAS